MKYWNSLSDLGTQLESSIVTFGNFDGVHLGHQAIFSQMSKDARLNGWATVAITFDPHPITVLKKVSVKLLSSLPDRISLIHQQGVTHCLVLPFTSEFLKMTAEEFLKKMSEQLKMKKLCMGEGSKFGHKGEGDLNYAILCAQKYGFEVSIPKMHSGECGVISSSMIRSKFESGNLKEIKALLGRNHFVSGVGVKGEGMGTKLGFPTLNVKTPSEILKPKFGVYRCRLTLDGESHEGVLNYGTRPTVNDTLEAHLEVHIPGVSFQGRGKKVHVEFVDWIRGEKKFGSLEALKAQIQKDVESFLEQK